MNCKIAKKVTKKQKEAMVDFILPNYQNLFGKFTSDAGKSSKKKLWHSLASQLNSLDGPTKNSEQWQRCWSDLKRNTKEKMTEIRQNRNQTGAGPIGTELTILDEKIIAVCGKQVIDGDENIVELGFYSPQKQCKTVH